MSVYTTGEIAEKCNVTVRTVQYYDKQGLMHPSAISEGGRRLYSDSDLDKLQEILMMKSLGVSLAVIKDVMESENGYEILDVFLEEQINRIEKETAELAQMKERIQVVKANIDSGSFNSVKSQADIERVMIGKKRLKKTYTITLIGGIIADILEVVGIVSWVVTGKPWIFLGCLCGVLLLGIPLVVNFYRNTAYICPECHAKFKPNKRQWFFAAHTPKLRKLTCTDCNYHGYCIESYAEDF